MEDEDDEEDEEEGVALSVGAAFRVTLRSTTMPPLLPMPTAPTLPLHLFFLLHFHLHLLLLRDLAHRHGDDP